MCLRSTHINRGTGEKERIKKTYNHVMNIIFQFENSGRRYNPGYSTTSYEEVVLVSQNVLFRREGKRRQLRVDKEDLYWILIRRLFFGFCRNP